MKPEIQRAIEEIRRAFSSVELDVEPDPEGGAYVRAHVFDLGTQYEPAQSWSVCRITFQYPFADIYPHFFVPNLKRTDGKPLGEGFHPNNKWQHPAGDEPATMVSRRSNGRNQSTETAAIKLVKVLEWVRSR